MENEKIKSLNIPGNILYDYIRAYNKAVYYYNKYHFDKDAKPTAKANTAEPLSTLTYEDCAKKLNNLSENDIAVLKNIQKECWKVYYNAVADKIYPVIDELLDTNWKELQ